MTRVKVVSDGESGPSQSSTGESGVLGKGIDLNGHLLGTFNLKMDSGMSLEGRIKDQNGTTLLAKLHKTLPLSRLLR